MLTERIQTSKYSFLAVKKEGRKEVNIQGKTVNLDYYESVYSPNTLENVLLSLEKDIVFLTLMSGLIWIRIF